MPSESEFHTLKVSRVIDETHDTRSFVLEIPPDLAQTFVYRAGQFCTFQAEIDGEQLGRCYSMSSSPDVGDPMTVTVKRVVGGRMSNWMNETVVPGSHLEVLRPAGLFVLRDSDQPIVAFAGGSGITPILSIVKSALAKTEREILLVYANKTREVVIFRDGLDRLVADANGRLEVHFHLDAESGFLDAAQCAALVGDRTGGDFYVCGPAPYMDVVEAGLATCGISDEQLFIERFDFDDSDSSTSEDSVPSLLTIRLGKREHEIPYQAGDTILDAARRAGLSDAPFSCQRGSCATCMAQLVEGSASMRVNNALTEEEVADGFVLTCQALPSGERVVVNYDF